MQASKEFLAELKVLTHVHHLNLVISRDLCNLLVFSFCISDKNLDRYSHFGIAITTILLLMECLDMQFIASNRISRFSNNL